MPSTASPSDMYKPSHRDKNSASSSSPRMRLETSPAQRASAKPRSTLSIRRIHPSASSASTLRSSQFPTVGMPLRGIRAWHGVHSAISFETRGCLGETSLPRRPIIRQSPIARATACYGRPCRAATQELLLAILILPETDQDQEKEKKQGGRRPPLQRYLVVGPRS